MASWWETLSAAQQFFWGLSIGVSLLFLVQNLLSLVVGGVDLDVDIDLDADADVDIDGDGGGIISFSNIVAFLTGFGWTGVTALSITDKLWLAIVLGVLIGVVFVVSVVTLMSLLSKLKSSGNISLLNAIGKEGVVTVRIPAKNAGKGKVSIEIQNRLMEVYALTEADIDLSRGDKIIVVNANNDELEVLQKP